MHTEKLRLVHNLITAVVRNTKAETVGKKVETSKEVNALKKLLQAVLGRKPKPEEVERVRADFWQDQEMA